MCKKKYNQMKFCLNRLVTYYHKINFLYFLRLHNNSTYKYQSNTLNFAKNQI